MPTIAIIGAGAMGSAVGRRLVDGGARVLTVLEGRSDKTIARAMDAGMERGSLADIAQADLILSIVPPSTAIAVAKSLVGPLAATGKNATFIDFNAISPSTMGEVASVLSKADCEVLDGSIIGGPPEPGGAGPTFYVSGDPDHRSEVLTSLQFKVRRIDGPIGAASALKMVYAGISKGTIGLGAAMLLAAARSGSAESLRTEMAVSLPEVQSRLRKSVPSMYPKAYRWVAEMQEIAQFLGPANPASKVFEGLAEIFSTFASDLEGDGDMISLVNQAMGLEPIPSREV